MPDWVDDPAGFSSDRLRHRRDLAQLAHIRAAPPPGEDPFECLLEAPPPTHEFWMHYADGTSAVEVAG